MPVRLQHLHTFAAAPSLKSVEHSPSAQRHRGRVDRRCICSGRKSVERELSKSGAVCKADSHAAVRKDTVDPGTDKE